MRLIARLGLTVGNQIVVVGTAAVTIYTHAIAAGLIGGKSRAHMLLLALPLVAPSTSGAWMLLFLGCRFRLYKHQLELQLVEVEFELSYGRKLFRLLLTGGPGGPLSPWGFKVAYY